MSEGYKVPAEEDKNFLLTVAMPDGDVTRIYYFKTKNEMEKLANRFRGYEMTRKEIRKWLTQSIK